MLIIKITFGDAWVALARDFFTGGHINHVNYLVAALEAGGVDYVTKPIKPKEIMDRMGVHL